jgi:hypothetical protein
MTPALVARASRRFGSLQAAGDAVYWSEGRPEEGGRQVIVRAGGGKPGAKDVLPLPYSARSRVHEYGGGEFLAVEGGEVFFVNDKDQQVHRIDATGAIHPRTRRNRRRWYSSWKAIRPGRCR